MASYLGLETFCGSLWDNISFLVPCARLSADYRNEQTYRETYIGGPIYS